MARSAKQVAAQRKASLASARKRRKSIGGIGNTTYRKTSSKGGSWASAPHQNLTVPSGRSPSMRTSRGLRLFKDVHGRASRKLNLSATKDLNMRRIT